MAALFLIQTVVGAASQHYRTEISGFFGFDLAAILPYNLMRTWHVQLALFWVSTSFIAAGIFLAPMIARREPRHQGKLIPSETRWTRPTSGMMKFGPGPQVPPVTRPRWNSRRARTYVLEDPHAGGQAQQHQGSQHDDHVEGGGHGGFFPSGGPAADASGQGTNVRRPSRPHIGTRPRTRQ